MTGSYPSTQTTSASVVYCRMRKQWFLETPNNMHLLTEEQASEWQRRLHGEPDRPEERLHQPRVKPTTCEGCGAPKATLVCSYCKRTA